MTIIDRDIEFYRGEAERAQAGLRRCLPDREPGWRAQHAAAQAVVDALLAYRASFEARVFDLVRDA